VVGRAKVGAIIQARVQSRRLPGKVLRSLPYGSGISIIENIVCRLAAVPRIDVVVVATSDRIENDNIVAVARAADAEVFRGSEDDVLERFYNAAKLFGLSQVVRLTADNPFLDPSLLSLCLETHEKRGADYTKTVGLPLGANFEVVTFRTLERLHRIVSRADEREHVTLRINRNPENYDVCVLDLRNSDYDGLRLTVDWAADYAFACYVFEKIHPINPIFGLDDVITLLKRHPWAKLINAHLNQEHHAL
jgi:spore coat polysaccharide biosynthesis protein SpsF